MAGQRTRFFGWCEPSAYCRKHDGAQLTEVPSLSSVQIGGPIGWRLAMGLAPRPRRASSERSPRSPG